MVWVKNILSKVNKFYSLANNSYNLISIAISEEEKEALLQKLREKRQKEKSEQAAPAQSGLYSKLVNVIRAGVSNGTIDTDDIDTSDLLLIAEEYKKAIELGSGFSTVWKNLKIFLRNNDIIGDDEDEENLLEDVINELREDLKTRAGGIANLNKPDDPNIVNQLVETRAVKQKEMLEEVGRDDGPSAFEIGLKEDSPEYNPLMSGDKQQFGVGTQKSFKDWAESYINEAKSYEDMLEESDEQTKSTIDELIIILKELSKLAKAKHQYSVKLELAPGDIDAETMLNKITQAMEPRLQKRNSLKSKLRLKNLEKKNQEILNKLQDPKLPLIDKLLLDQKLKLNELLVSRDYGREKEKQLRQNLIAILEGKILKKNPDGTFTRVKSPGREGALPSGETLRKMLQEIENAKQERLARKEVETKIRHEKIHVNPELGRENRNKVNWDIIKLNDFIKVNLKDALLTPKDTAKKALIAELKKSGKLDNYKKLIDAVGLSVNKPENKEKILSTVKDLTVAIRNDIRTDSKIGGLFVKFIITSRSNKFLYDFRNKLQVLEKMGIEERSEFTDMEKQVIQEVIDLGLKLSNYYYNLRIPRIKSSDKLIMHYNAIADMIFYLSKRLEKIIE